MKNIKQSRASKFRNQRTIIDGFKFDSKLEAEYYQLLKFKKAQGHIQDFRLQPRYVLQDKFTHDGKVYRKIEYVADFEIIQNDGTVCVVDTKGVQTADFKIKAKLFIKKYGTLKLVKRDRGRLTTEDF